MDYTKSKASNISKITLRALFVGALFFVPVVKTDSIYAQSVSDSVSITAIVVAPATNENPPPSSGGGGGGGGSSVSIPDRNVSFEGVTFPKAFVSLLKDGKLIASSNALSDGTFKLNIQGVSSGTYGFSLQARDSQGRKTLLQNYTVSIASETTTLVRNLLIMPSFSLDKSVVKKDDSVTISGEFIPNGFILLVLSKKDENGVSTVVATSSALVSSTGVWSHTWSSKEASFGGYTFEITGSYKNQQIPYLANLVFEVGSETVVNKIIIALPQDLNGDNKVNIRDFSIMAFWYKRPNPPAQADMNKDGKIDLVDFSIMAYYWTE